MHLYLANQQFVKRFAIDSRDVVDDRVLGFPGVYERVRLVTVELTDKEYMEGTIRFAETVGTVIEFDIDPGHYTPQQLADHLSDLLNQYGTSNYSIVYNSSRSRFTVSSDLTGGGGYFEISDSGGFLGTLQRVNAFTFESTRIASDNILGMFLNGFVIPIHERVYVDGEWHVAQIHTREFNIYPVKITNGQYEPLDISRWSCMLEFE